MLKQRHRKISVSTVSSYVQQKLQRQRTLYQTFHKHILKVITFEKIFLFFLYISTIHTQFSVGVICILVWSRRYCVWMWALWLSASPGSLCHCDWGTGLEDVVECKDCVTQSGAGTVCFPELGSLYSSALFLVLRTKMELLSVTHWRSCLWSCGRQRSLGPIYFGGLSAASENSAQTDNPPVLQRNPWSALENGEGLCYQDCRRKSSDTYNYGRGRTHHRYWSHIVKDTGWDAKPQKLYTWLSEKSGKKPSLLALWWWEFRQDK